MFLQPLERTILSKNKYRAADKKEDHWKLQDWSPPCLQNKQEQTRTQIKANRLHMQSRIGRFDSIVKVVIVEMGNTKLQSLVLLKLNAELYFEINELWSLVRPTLNSPDYLESNSHIEVSWKLLPPKLNWN